MSRRNLNIEADPTMDNHIRCMLRTEDSLKGELVSISQTMEFLIDTWGVDDAVRYLAPAEQKMREALSALESARKAMQPPTEEQQP